MQEAWKSFVYPLVEDRKHDVEEDSYHLHIENQLITLGWAPWKNEIKHKPCLRIGNRNSIQPDILVTRDGEDQFVIEVKRPNHVQLSEDINQLESYMRQLRLKVGIYIGERLEIFYDKPDEKHVVSVLQIPIELDEKRGSRFVELFSKDVFSKDEIIGFCEQRIQELHRQANLNKIKEGLVSDAQKQISESLCPYLMDKYGNSFSEEEIKGMLATLQFAASSIDSITPVIAPVTKKTPDQSANTIKCHLSRNAEAHGIFNVSDQSLIVLKGSYVNALHLTERVKLNRAKQLEKYTEKEERNGRRVVMQDVRFESPSGAAVFCVGGSANGWTTWKDEQGRELVEYRNNQKDTRHTVESDHKGIDPHQIQLDFWTRFRDKLKATKKIPSLQTPKARYWYDIRLGRSQILLSNVCNTQKNFVGVKLYIRKPSVEKYFPALIARKSEINLALGSEPVWDANPSAQDKTIALFYQANLSDPKKTEEALEWMVRQTLVFYRVFSRIVKEI